MKNKNQQKPVDPVEHFMAARAGYIALENSLAKELPRDSGSVQPGVICLANDSRFAEAYFSEPLTTYATGFPIEDASGDLDFLCPRVTVPRKFEHDSYDNIYELMTELVDDERAIGAAFKQVQFRAAKTVRKTVNRGLTIVLDRDELVPGINNEQIAVAKLKRRLILNELRRACVLYAAATAAAETWNGTAGSDADSDVATDIVASITTGGARANRVFYGATAWSKRFLDCRKQSTAGGFASSGLSEQQLAQLLGIEGVRFSRAAYQSTTSAKAEVAGSVVFVFNQQNSPDVYDPSNVKRFVTPAMGGGDWGVYVQEDGPKRICVTVEHYSLIVTVKSTGMYYKAIT